MIPLKGILTEEELKSATSELRILVAFKAGVKMYAVFKGGYYVITFYGRDVYWTFNESQAVAFYNTPTDKIESSLTKLYGTHKAI